MECLCLTLRLYGDKEKIVDGADLVRIKLQIISPCDSFKILNQSKEHQISELVSWCERVVVGVVGYMKVINKVEDLKKK
jgi:hypothetical protein